MFFGPGGLPQFGVNTPLPHSAPNVATSPFQAPLPLIPMHIQVHPVSSGPMHPNTFHSSALIIRGVATTSSLTTRLSRQHFRRRIAKLSTVPSRAICVTNIWCCLPTLNMSAHFLLPALQLCRFRPIHSRPQALAWALVPSASVCQSRNPFNPFTVPDATLVINGVPVPVTARVFFRGINDTGPTREKITYWDSLFDVGLRGEMGEFGDYFKTWNWEMGFRYSRNEGQNLLIGAVSQTGLRDALLDTNPATAFDPFLNFTAHNTRAARSRVYVNLQNSGQFELPLGYATINGDLFNLPAGPVSFAIGGEYRGERWARDRDPLTSTFQSIPSGGGKAHG